jgi:hypothetical protein
LRHVGETLFIRFIAYKPKFLFQKEITYEKRIG